MNALSPMILQAQIAPPAGGGSFGLADTTKLENPFMAPMWLDEIRFSNPGGTPTAWTRIRVELKLGNLSLTNGFVPISLLGKILNETYSLNRVTWKLPKPLFVPAGELLRPTLYYETYSGAPAQTIAISYACRPMARNTPQPKTLQVPWATFFKPPDLTAGSTDRTDQSTPSDIFNPFEVDLHVQRFVGRFMPQSSPTELSGGMGLASVLTNITTGALITGSLISAQDSMNNILIRDRTPFSHVFSELDRSWTVNCLLPSKGFYLFVLDRLWSGYDGTAITATNGIAMIGWREVNT